MKRVLVLGQPASGKSTLSKSLAAITGLPYVELDRLRFDSNLEMIPRSDWIEITESLVAEDRWILDGVYIASLDQRLARADTVIVLQPGRLRCTVRWFRRMFFRKERWLKFGWANLPLIWSWSAVMMPRIWAKVETRSLACEYQVHHLVNKGQVREFLDSFDQK